MKSKYKHLKSEKFMDKYIIKGIKSLFSKNPDSKEKKEKYIPVHLISEKKEKQAPKHLNVKEAKPKTIKTSFFKSSKNEVKDLKPKRYPNPKRENRFVQLNSEKKEKYEPKHLNLEETKSKGTKTLFLRKSRDKTKNSELERYTGCGIMKKIKAFSLATIIGLSYTVNATTWGNEINPIADSNNSLTEELSVEENESPDNLDNIEIIIDEKDKLHKVSLNLEAEKSERMDEKENIKKVDILHSQSNAKKDNISETEIQVEKDDILDSISEVSDGAVPEVKEGDTLEQSQENINSESEISELAMAEFRISEDEMLTEGEILYACTKLIREWKGEEEEIDNIKEMMDALLHVQKEFGVHPLAIVSIAHCESRCGFDYKKYGQIRLVNNLSWRTPEGEYVQVGVTGYSKADNYCLFDTVDNAVYDVANYFTNSWALEGAKTMWDLENNKDLHIFNGASREGAYTFNKLKEYAKEYRNLYEIKVGEDSAEVTIYDVSEAVGGLKTEDIHQIAEEVISRSQSKNLEDKEEVSERE